MWKWEWICWFVNLVSRSPAQRVRRYRKLIERLSREADLDGGWWNVFRQYPKRPTASNLLFTSESAGGVEPNRVAVVMQGPVTERDQLTVETLQLYRNTMPQAELIFSTWDDIPTAVRDQIAAMGVTVVTGEKPEQSGPHHLNFQVTSTHRGLLEAKRLGCRYALKTRSDTRIHMAGVDRFCRDLSRQFPVQGQQSQRERFIVVDFATRLYVPYHPSDLMMFGTTDDLIQYWSPLTEVPQPVVCNGKFFGELLQQPIPEVVLCRRYLRHCGLELDHGMEQWWQVLADRFIVVDRDMIDLFWPKYNYNVDSKLGKLGDTSNMALCHFAQWMQLYSRPLSPSVTIDQLQHQRVHDPVDAGQQCIVAT